MESEWRRGPPLDLESETFSPPGLGWASAPASESELPTAAANSIASEPRRPVPGAHLAKRAEEGQAGEIA